MKSNASRCCAFCGSPADSKEHVFAQRLCKRAGAVKFAVIPGLFVEGQGTKTRPKHHIEGFQVRHVCAGCNNNWMEKLESWFEQYLGFLIEPDWPKLALAMIEALKTERNKLAQWMMKTAVMFSLGSMQGQYRVDFAPAVTRRIKDGILPKNLWVDLGYSELSTVGGTISRGFRVINAGQYIPNMVLKKGDGFKFIIQFNHLLLRIAQAPGANVTYDSQRGELPVRLYPTPSPELPDNFAYSDIMKFEHSVILKTWQNCRGNIV